MKEKILAQCNKLSGMFLVGKILEGVITLEDLKNCGIDSGKLLQIENIVAQKEEELWKDISSKGDDVAAMEKYLASFPNGMYAKQISARLEQIVEAPWYEARNADTIEAYRKYLDEFPGKHDKEANDRITSLVNEETLKREKNEWQIACLEDTIEAYQQYLKKYKSGIYADDADRRIANIYRLESSQKDEADWMEACRINSYSSYSQYEQTHPSGEYVEEARRKKRSMEIIEQLRLDPNFYGAMQIRRMIEQQGLLTWNDLELFYGVEKTYAIRSFIDLPELPFCAPPEALKPDTTEVFFWGIKSSGKTCTLGAVLSYADNEGLLTPIGGKGARYMDLLENIFTSSSICTLPPSSPTECIQEMILKLKDNRGRQHEMTLIDLAGEVFSANYKERKNLPLRDDEREALEKMRGYLSNKKNKKIHFFVVEYGAHDRILEGGVTMKQQLRDMALYLKEKGIFKDATNGVYIIVTKCDKMPCSREQRKDAAYEYVEKYLRGFLENLNDARTESGIGDFSTIAFSVGDVFAKNLCLFDSSDAKKIIEKLILKTPAERRWLLRYLSK